MLLQQLIGHNIRILHLDSPGDFVFLSDNTSLRVKLFQIIHHCVLNVYIGLRENINRSGAFLQTGEVGLLADVVDDGIGTFKETDARREELIEFDYLFHLV